MPSVDLRQRILAENEAAARALRHRFAASHTLVPNLISSPGAGKTSLLEATVGRMAPAFAIGVIEGDVATERDADRLRALGVRAVQIITGGACHLDARQVARAFEEAAFPPLDILFVENVGNLICPTSYDLGEDFKVALLSVTEGDDKPFKYPAIFSRAEVTVITKLDLLPHADFDLEAVAAQVRTLRPDGVLLTTSARTGEGMEAWCEWLAGRLRHKRGGTS